MECNGHKNRNHWNVNLWINNDEKLYRVAREIVMASRNKDQAARSMFEYLRDTGRTYTPDGAPYSVTTIRAALRNLDA